MFRHLIQILIFASFAMPRGSAAQSDFRIPPYIQNPDFTSISVLWFTDSDQPGEVEVSDESGVVMTVQSSPTAATELAYPIWEVATNPDDFPGGIAPPPPYKHRVRLEGLEWSKRYSYVVRQSGEEFASFFNTPAGILQPLRFAVYGDSETEPESDGAKVAWSDPAGIDPDRQYLIDQTTGYENNLEILRGRDLDFVAIAGDLVQSGGEQRDWDRFWEHNTSMSAETSLAGRIPIIAVPGNHEYYATPHRAQTEQYAKAYRQPFSEEAMSKYAAYFEAPSNGTGDAREGRFYRFNYGPVAIIAIDACNNGLNQLADDTNFQLLGEDDTDGGRAPSFAPGSPQYVWLEEQLADAQEVSPFTFVLLHYSPYSVGPHGWPAGDEASQDPLSGVPVRSLTPLFQQYGVDAVFAGHDEMWERSVLDGTELLPNGGERPHQIQFYDVGVGGDGLRGSVDGLDNPYQRFLAHTDAPEIWSGPRLVDGGKHYGHLEVSIDRTGSQTWEATLTPAYAFPLFDESGTQYLGFERRVYDDVVTLTSRDDLRTLSQDREIPDLLVPHVSQTFPNPTTTGTSIRVELPMGTHVAITAFDVLGRSIRTVQSEHMTPGEHVVRWDGRTEYGESVPAGMYLLRIESGEHVAYRTITVL